MNRMSRTLSAGYSRYPVARPSALLHGQQPLSLVEAKRLDVYPGSPRQLAGHQVQARPPRVTRHVSQQGYFLAQTVEIKGFAPKNSHRHKSFA
jgi:hypothetical protein